MRKRALRDDHQVQTTGRALELRPRSRWRPRDLDPQRNLHERPAPLGVAMQEAEVPNAAIATRQHMDEQGPEEVCEVQGAPPFRSGLAVLLQKGDLLV